KERWILNFSDANAGQRSSEELPDGEREIVRADWNARASLRGAKDEFSAIYNLWTASGNFLRPARRAEPGFAPTVPCAPKVKIVPQKSGGVFCKILCHNLCCGTQH